METDMVDSPTTNQSAADKNDQSLEEKFNNTTINDNTVTENAGTNLPKQFESKTNHDSRDKSKYQKGRGHFFKNSLDNNSTSKHFQNNDGYVRGRGRGRGVFNKTNEKHESFDGGYNNNNGSNTTLNSRGRGRGHYRGRGERFGAIPIDSSYGTNKCDNRKNGNDNVIGPKTTYIPPDIENEESIDGIEAGLNFDKYETIEVKVSGTDVPKRITSFSSSGLQHNLLENLSVYNFFTPTPIQNYAIPIIIAGRDLMACAQTGSGKTAAFVLPILHNLLSQPTPLIFDENHCEPHVVIIAPTRELVIQINECVWKFSKGTIIRNALLYGGTSIPHQISKITQGGVHILTATPGRLNGFVQKGIVTFSSVRFFILDEADRMLDMGFKPAIEQALKHQTMPPNNVRQTLMFSATFGGEIQSMATIYLKPDYIFVAVGEIGGACKDVTQTFIEVTKFEKKKALIKLFEEMENCQGTIVFVEQIRTADYIAAYLSELDIPTTSIHGAREQPERECALNDFKKGRMKVLVATAVAARGLDIKVVKNVVNFDLPNTIEEYVHRIGRTGRLGNAGKAISFFDPERDGPLASELSRILKQADQEVPLWFNDAAQGAQNNSTTENFDDIRTDVEVTSELVPLEEEEW